MKKVVILLGAMAALFCVFTYGVGYLFFHQTKISDEEILIGRIGTVPLSRTKYTVNLETGDEEITRHSFFGQLWHINYEGECRCITKVHKFGSYYVALAYKKKRVFYSTEEGLYRVVPYEQERHKFEEGLTIRNALKEQYVDIFPS